MHFLQSEEWRSIKDSLGNKTYKGSNFWIQSTALPLINRRIGYAPRVNLNKVDLNEMYEIGKREKLVYISIDPENEIYRIQNNFENELPIEGESGFNEIKTKFNLKIGEPTHLRENIVLDIDKNGDEIIQSFKQKHRYNLKIAEKNEVKVEISNSEESFETFLKIYSTTVLRKKYYGRSEEYIRKVWKVLKDKQIGYIATAIYQGRELSSWMLVTFEDTIYYPYGGSLDQDRNVMANYKLVWDIISWGKDRGFKNFDLWGIERKEDRDFDGFSRFKVGFGGFYILYEPTYDLIIDKNLYPIVKILRKIRDLLK